jgi:hypothetical protein
LARLYANERFPFPVVEALRRLGHDVQTVQDAKSAGQRMPDEEVLPFALGERRAVLTLNRRHFVRLHLDGHPHSGIIACTIDPNFSAQAGRIHTAIVAEPLLAQKLLRIGRQAD